MIQSNHAYIARIPFAVSSSLCLQQITLRTHATIIFQCFHFIHASNRVNWARSLNTTISMGLLQQSLPIHPSISLPEIASSTTLFMITSFQECPNPFHLAPTPPFSKRHSIAFQSLQSNKALQKTSCSVPSRVSSSPLTSSKTIRIASAIPGLLIIAFIVLEFVPVVSYHIPAISSSNHTRELSVDSTTSLQTTLNYAHLLFFLWCYVLCVWSYFACVFTRTPSFPPQS